MARAIIKDESGEPEDRRGRPGFSLRNDSIVASAMGAINNACWGQGKKQTAATEEEIKGWRPIM